MSRESTPGSRSWRVMPLNFVARLKHKFNKKVDEHFVSHFFPAETSAPPPSWSGAHDCQFPYHNEASSSNHTSAPNSQYFDATDAPEYLQQYQIGQDHMISPSMDTSVLGDVETPMSVAEYVDMAEFSDVLMEMEMQQPHQQSINLHSHQYYYTAPSPTPSATTIHEMSTDTVETDTTDTGNSTFTDNSTFTGNSTFPSGSYILPPHPVHPRRTVIRNLLTVREVKSILFGEERSRFSVVASIVYAYRKFKTLLQRRRSRCSSTPSTIIPTSPMISSCRNTHSSRLYQGVKQRKGKWVAEIRVSRMPDKVWLGSFPLEKQAALAYDLGLHHCSVKRNKVFNFRDSPQRLGPSQYAGLRAMSKEDRKLAVQTMAGDYARAYGES